MSPTRRPIKPLTVISIAVLCVLAVCTFLSRTIAGAMLPVVETRALQAMRLPLEATATGAVGLDDTWSYTPQQAYRVRAVPVQAGQALQPGDAVLEIDVSEELLYARELALRIEYDAAQNTAHLTREQRDIAARQLELERERLAIYKASFPADGVIRADEACRVVQVGAQAGQKLAEDVPAVVFAPLQAAAHVAFSLAGDAAQLFDAGDAVTLRYNAVGQDAAGTRQMASRSRSAAVARKTYDAASGTYRFYAPLGDADVDMNTAVQVTVSRSTEVYENVVPRSAIIEKQPGKPVVYVLARREGLFGQEWFAQETPVEITAENALYAAVSGNSLSPQSQVIVASSGALDGGVAVRVEP